MAIKSKNRYNIAVIIVSVLIVLFSILFVNSYSYIDKLEMKEAQKKWNTGEIQGEQAKELAIELINFNMGIYKEIGDELAGKVRTNQETFLDIKTKDSNSDTDDNIVFLSNLINNRANIWTYKYNDFKNFLNYRVIDNTGNIIKEYKGDRFDNTRTSKIVLQYNDLGVMSILENDVKLDTHSDIASNSLVNALENYKIFNPVEECLNSYVDNAESVKKEFDIAFKGPKNLTFEYEFNPDIFFGYYNAQNVNINYRLDVFLAVMLVIFIVIFLLGVVVSFLKDYNSDTKDPSNMPIEIVIFTLVLEMLICVSYISRGVVIAISDVSILDRFINVLLSVLASQIMFLILNTLFWIQALFVIFWSTVALCGIPRLGLKRYFSERSIIGKFIVKVVELIIKFYNGLLNIDFNENISKGILKIVIGEFVVLSALTLFKFNNIYGFAIYCFVVFFILNYKMKPMKRQWLLIYDQLDAMSKGNLDVTIDEELGELEEFKQKLLLISKGMKIAIEKELEIQKSKSELITNMSHDLKTPLTAIIMYINLLKDKNISEEERNKYIDILDTKSMRLKGLIDDLFEMSMASTGNLKLELEEVDIVNLLKGLRLEYSDKMEESGIDFRWSLPDEKLILNLDAKKTYRIFENLIVNITKYALASSRAYIDCIINKEFVDIKFKNISEREIIDDPQKLLGRFARGDVSRNTEGFGLGLAIAKNLVEAQGGNLNVEVNDDIFTATVRFYVNNNSLI